jgi:hypothetical protein
MEKGHGIWNWNVSCQYRAGSPSVVAGELAKYNSDFVIEQKTVWTWVA